PPHAPSSLSLPDALPIYAAGAEEHRLAPDVAGLPRQLDRPAVLAQGPPPVAAVEAVHVADAAAQVAPDVEGTDRHRRVGRQREQLKRLVVVTVGLEVADLELEQLHERHELAAETGPSRSPHGRAQLAGLGVDLLLGERGPRPLGPVDALPEEAE